MVEVLRGATREIALYKVCTDVARRGLDWRRQAFFDELKVRKARPESNQHCELRNLDDATSECAVKLHIVAAG